MAFLSGGVVLDTIKEELPKERESNVFAFPAGTLVYGALLLSLEKSAPRATASRAGAA
ncbi:MAG: hypothetical protein ACLFQ5_02820 [Oceanicaulis sp.]